MFIDVYVLDVLYLQM